MHYCQIQDKQRSELTNENCICSAGRRIRWFCVDNKQKTKSAAASRLSHTAFGSSPPAWLSWISKYIHQFLQTEKCIAFHLFWGGGGGQRSILTPGAITGADRWEENRGVWIRVDTSTCRQTCCTSEPALRSRDGHISLFGYRQILSAKKHSWAGRQEAIWYIDNEINTEEQTKETSVCTRCDCFNSQRTSREGGEQWKKHTSWKGRLLYLSGCISVGSFHFILTAKVKQTEITTTEIWCLNWEERSVVPLFCLFVLKTSLAAESTSLSEYKRCLRGNISEVLCWWLTVWQTSGVKLQLRSVRKKKVLGEKKQCTWVMCKRKGREKKGILKTEEVRGQKKLIYIL